MVSSRSSDVRFHFNTLLRAKIDREASEGEYVFSYKWPTSQEDARAGLLVRESIDSRWVTGIGWDRFLSAQGHNPWSCMHLAIQVGPLLPGESRSINGRIYLFRGRRDECFRAIRERSGFLVQIGVLGNYRKLMEKYAEFGHSMPPVLRLGIATRGNTHLTEDDVMLALERGINYWNWCGHHDGMSRAIRQLGSRRTKVVVAMQMVVQGCSENEMKRALEEALVSLNTEWLDIATLYYVESQSEWNELTTTGGALEALQAAKQEGTVSRDRTHYASAPTGSQMG